VFSPAISASCQLKQSLKEHIDRKKLMWDQSHLSGLSTSAGLAFPPFYFYNGGIRELFAILKQHVIIIRFPFWLNGLTYLIMFAHSA
jgi:hypothetical protein